MGDTLFVVGAGLLHCYTIRQAQSMGLSVIATDGSMYAPGLALADVPIVCDVYDIERHRALACAFAKEYHLVGATCAGGDAAPTVSAVAEEAGLPGMPCTIAKDTWNKLAVRTRLTCAGLHAYQPPYCWRTGKELYPVNSVLQVLDFPLVVKPLSQRASRGVTLVDTADGLHRAITSALTYGSCLLFEERLVGSEHSAEIVLDAQNDCVHFHMCDRLFSYEDGYSIELGHVNPSRLPLDQQAQVKQMLLNCAHALGVTWGPFKTDVMWTAQGPKVLEVAARPSGGFDSQVSYPRSSGDNLLQRVIQVACSLPVTPQPPLRSDCYCAVAAIIPRTAGTVRTLPDLGGEVLWMFRPGEKVQPPEHCAQRAGFVVIEGTDYGDAWRNARELAEAYAEALEEETVCAILG